MRGAAAIAETLRAAIPAHAEVELHSSDLQRAAQAADVIGELLHVPPVLLDPRLREKSYGEAEGQTQEWLRQRFITPPAIGIPGSETMGAFGERVYTAHQIVVTHGGVITFAVGAWTRLPIDALSYARFNGPSGSITELREDDYFHNRQVVRLGDTRHLEPANTPLG